MNWLDAIVLGLVEGITEYLPISSTGHLIVAAAALGLDTPARKESVDTFNIVIQGGAILAVLALYWPRFVAMVKGLIGRDRAGLALLANLSIAFVPAAVAGLLLNSLIKAHLFNPRNVAIAFIAGGVYMLAVEILRTRRNRVFDESTFRTFGAPQGLPLERLTPLQALFIGCLQCVALIPGVSRSMMTITGGLFVRLSPAAAAEFSFLLGMPTLLAATLYSGWKNVRETSAAPDQQNFLAALGPVAVMLGIVVAMVSAGIAVRWLVGALNRWGLIPFAVYRVLFGVLILILLRAGVLSN